MNDILEGLIDRLLDKRMVELPKGDPIRPWIARDGRGDGWFWHEKKPTKEFSAWHSGTHDFVVDKEWVDNHTDVPWEKSLIHINPNGVGRWELRK